MYETFFKRMLDRKKALLTNEYKQNRERYKNVLQYILKLNNALEAERNEDTKSKLQAQITKLEQEKSRLSEMGISESEPIKEMERMYQGLLEHPKIDSIAIHETQNMIVVHTKPIVVRGVDIGRYTIRIYFNDNRINIRRSDGSVVHVGDKNVLHPYITPTGICYGSHQENVNNALKQGGFYSLIMFSISLLECRQGVDGGFCGWTAFLNAIKANKLIYPGNAIYEKEDE